MPLPDAVPPDPMTPYPMPDYHRVGFLKPLLDNPLIEVGDYTYYDDPEGPETFAKNVLYHYDFIGDRLIIGKFCAIAWQTKFIMNGANHRASGPSSYPFLIFGGAWSGRFEDEAKFPYKGDTRIGNDVWLGYDSLIMPGVTIGDGAIVAARSVVTHDVPPYAIVAGNPARIVRMRFPEADIATLLALRWWDWPTEKITAHIPEISGGSVSALAAVG